MTGWVGVVLLALLAVVTAPARILSVVTAPLMMFTASTASVPSFSVVTAPLRIGKSSRLSPLRSTKAVPQPV